MNDYLNINEAAKLTGLSIPTIRTKLERKLLPNATQVKQGKRKFWRIPVTDLAAAGLLDKVKATEPESYSERTLALEAEIDRLTRELEHARELLARADRELEDFRTRERQLYLTLETRETQERRRSLWQRLTGS